MRHAAREAWLLALDFAEFFWLVTACRVIGHDVAVQQNMAAGPIWVCARCRMQLA